MLSLIDELVYSNKPMLWELGHCLADNLILKIGLYLAEINRVFNRSFASSKIR